MINSLQNNKVKYVRRLQADRRFRAREQAFVVEGVRWLAELGAGPEPPRQLFATADWLKNPSQAELLAELEVPVQLVTTEVMAAMSDTETPQGVLAVVEISERPFVPTPTLLLILDSIRDPGNLGTILRTAAAAGVDGVWLGPGCVDAYNPKVVRSSMGALLRLPLAGGSWPEIGVSVKGLTVYLAAADGILAYTAADWTQPAALIIGSEADGAGQQAARLAQERIAIPIQHHTESLNAAVATGVILFEAVRQRSVSGDP
ncbi:MAG: RNA methyltransferase [Chloroflexota bacterium]